MEDERNIHRQSARESAIAEMIITDLDKLFQVQQLILKNNQSLLHELEEIKANFKSIDADNRLFETYLQKHHVSTQQYIKLTELSIKLADNLNLIREKGIKVNITAQFKQEFKEIFKSANKPFMLYLLQFAIGISVVLLSILILLLF